MPGKIEQKLREEITDSENGLGYQIFSLTEGYNFLIKMGATKPGKDGMQFADYSSSTFARKSSVLANGDESLIKSYLESTVNLKDFINSQDKTPEDFISILQDEMLMDYPGLSQELNKFMGVDVTPTVHESKAETTSVEDMDKMFDKAAEKNTTIDTSESEDEDAKLLAELENL